MFQELKEGVEHPPGFAHIVGHTAFGSESVKLVEQVDGSGRRYRIEDKAQLSCGFPHVLADQHMELDGEERQLQTVRKRGR